MTLDIIIDEQLLEFNAELRKENEQLRTEKELFKKDSEIYFNKWRDTIDDLRHVEKQRDINYKAESAMREKYDKLKEEFNNLTEDYTSLLLRHNRLKNEIETLRSMIKLGDFIDD